MPDARRHIGEYALVRELGRGGMGVVYEAVHARHGRVALKVVLSVGASEDVEGMARMRREAEALRRLRHPNVVAVHEVGEHQGHPFVAMAFVPGESLGARLRRGPLPAADAARIAEGLARALVHAHAHGVLHRDLKPDNVLLTLDGDEPVLVDFGLARLALDRRKLTATGQVIGTPAYMAPEQAMGLALGAQADVYGLGATLYEMLCGRPPFSGATALAVMSKVASGSPPPPSRVRPGVDAALERLCLACMEREPGRRPPAEDVVEALERWAAERARRPRRRAGGRAALAAGGALLVLGGAALGLVRHGAGGEGAVAPASSARTPAAVAPTPAPTPPPPPTPPTSPPPSPAVDPAASALEALRPVVWRATRGLAEAQEVLRAVEEACERAPGSGRLWLLRAWVVHKVARAAADAELLEAASAHLARAREAGGCPPGQLEALGLQLDQDRVDIDAYRRAVVADRRDVELAALCRALGRRAEAIQRLDELSDVDPGAGYQRAGEVWAQGRSEEAIAAYKQAYLRLRGQPGADNLRLFCFMRTLELVNALERHAEALAIADELRDVPTTDENVARILAQAAIALHGLGRHEEAAGAALEAAQGFAGLASERLRRDGAIPLATAARALVRLGRADEGREALRRALALVTPATMDEGHLKSFVHDAARGAFAGDPELLRLADEAFP